MRRHSNHQSIAKRALGLTLYCAFLFFLCLPIASAADDWAEANALLGNWEIKAIHHNTSSIELNNCGLGSIEIRQQARAIGIYSCLNNQYTKQCRVPGTNGTLNNTRHLTHDAVFLCDITVPGSLFSQSCSRQTECDHIRWHCRHQKLGSIACESLYDACAAKVQLCDLQREKVLTEEQQNILKNVSSYTFNDHKLTLSNDSGGLIQLKRIVLPPELKAEKDEYENRLETIRLQNPSAIARLNEYPPFNRLQISYLPKEKDNPQNLFSGPLYWDNYRNSDYSHEFIAHSSEVTFCPESTQWHPSQAITDTTYKNHLKWSWRKQRLQNGDYCLIMLSPLLGPMGEEDLKNFQSNNTAQINTWLQKALPAKQYELHSPSGEVICLPGNGSAWWDERDNFFEAEKFVFDDITLIDDTNFSQKTSQINLGRRIAAQKVTGYLTEHATIWTDTWDQTTSSDITPSQHINRYFQITDQHNPRIIHLVRSKTIPPKLNHRALRWYIGYIVLDQYTESVITQFTFRVYQPGWVIDFSIPILSSDWVLSMHDELYQFAQQEVKHFFQPCTAALTEVDN